ncbi:MAG TPA: LuxR C-terminal-related transcriptional regulator [Xanthomonadaceae bacterium]|jgi:LuxR family maltose regulon positive regulatory protein
MLEAEFVLKTTPPRLPRTALERDRLSRLWDTVSDRTAIAVVAPAGFGKTTLLAHWRRRWLADGALVAWLTADRNDDRARFTMALLHTIRVASGRAALDTSAVENAANTDHGIDTLTGLLAEIASLGRQTVLIVDEAERLPDASQRLLAYLLYNAPSNLHVAIGTRTPLDLRTSEIAARGLSATLKVDDLRLQLDETTAILERRFGERLSLDDGVRLHEATEGWPIGLQLAIATIEPEHDLSAAIRSLSGRQGDIERYFIESLLARLSPPLAGFLVRVAILDRMEAAMCETVTGCASATAFLEQLMLDTPMLVVGEQQGWLRLHPLVRDFLLGRFEALPREEQAELHRRACDWFAAHQRFPEAASHALAAGDEARALELAVKSLWTLRTQGKFAEAQAWLARIPPESIASDTYLRLIAAWVTALGEGNARAYEVAREVLADDANDPHTLFIAALVASSATGYSDHIGLVPDIFARWPDVPDCVTEPVCALAYRNGLANLQLHTGHPEAARRLLGMVPPDTDGDSAMLALSYRTMLLAMSHIWEGDPAQAEALLRPALEQAERVAGRRSMVASMFAAGYAAALVDRDQPEAARALLANRLDVIERTGFPDAILLAYRTLTYVALGQGDGRRALGLLDGLAALAERRRLPRIAMHALAMQIRVHAQRDCLDTVARLVAQLEALAPEFERAEFRPYLPQYRLATALAKVQAALARGDLDAVEPELRIADACATALHRRRDALMAKALRAVWLRMRNEPQAMAVLGEAQQLAAIGGNARLLADTHPLAAQMAVEWHRMTTGLRVVRGSEPAATSAPSPAAARATSHHCGPLTPKESEVLALLDKGMSNKQIARAMDISDETVKWHVKNLFLKLSAGTRKHVVDRARLLGLVGS